MKNGLHILEQNGSPIHFWLDGIEDAPLIAFTHGATVDHRMFEEQITVLRNDYRILTWDVRGHGESQPIGNLFTLVGCADDLIALLDAIGYQRAAFVGQSMGGNIIQELLIKFPQRASAVVMIDCACNTLHLSSWEKFLIKLSVPLLRMYPAGMLRDQVARVSSVQPAVQAYIKESAQIVLASGHFMDVWTATIDCLHEVPIIKSSCRCYWLPGITIIWARSRNRWHNGANARVCHIISSQMPVIMPIRTTQSALIHSCRNF